MPFPLMQPLTSIYAFYRLKRAIVSMVLPYTHNKGDKIDVGVVPIHAVLTQRRLLSPPSPPLPGVSLIFFLGRGAFVAFRAAPPSLNTSAGCASPFARSASML